MAKGLKIDAKDYSHLTSKKIGIATAEWNDAITFALRDAALATLKSQGWAEDKIEQILVPGTFELPTAAKWLAERNDIDAVIALGCVIQGATRHFDFICQAVSQSLANLGMATGKPVIFGVLTTNDEAQAKERAGGAMGNKGEEAAWSAIKMLDTKEKLAKSKAEGGIGFRR